MTGAGSRAGHRGGLDLDGGGARAGNQQLQAHPGGHLGGGLQRAPGPSRVQHRQATGAWGWGLGRNQGGGLQRGPRPSQVQHRQATGVWGWGVVGIWGEEMVVCVVAFVCV